MIRNRLGASARGTPRVPSSGGALPDGTAVGDLLQWDGSAWVPVAGGGTPGDFLIWNGTVWEAAPGAFLLPAVEVSNSVAVEPYATYTISEFTSGRRVGMQLSGDFVFDDGGSETHVRILVSYGGVTLFSSQNEFPFAADATRRAWWMEVLLVAEADNDQQLSGWAIMPYDTVADPAAIGYGSIWSEFQFAGNMGGESAVDGTVPQDLVVSLQMDQAAAANTIRCYGAIVTEFQ